MKKLWLIILFAGLLALWACSNKNVTNEENWSKNKIWVNHQTVSQNVDNKGIKNNSWKIINNSKNNTKNEVISKSNSKQDIYQTNVNNKKKLQQRILIKEDETKIEDINRIITSVWWFKVDCKKEFKTAQWQYQCEMNQLREAGYGCTDPKFPKLSKDSLNSYFTKKRYNLLDMNIINQYKNICKQNIIEQEKQEQQAKKEQEHFKKMQNKLKQVQQQAKDFKIENCKKIAKKQKFPLPPKNILNTLPPKVLKRLKNWKQNFIKRCEIGVVLNYKNWNCSLLKKYWLDKECEQIKRDITIYRRMQQESREYGSFNLIRYLAPNLYWSNGLYQSAWPASNFPAPSWF